MSTEAETCRQPDRRPTRRGAVAILLLSAVSLAAGLWLGFGALLLAVPTLWLAWRYRSATSGQAPAPKTRFLPAVVHGVGMLIVFLVVPGVLKVRDAARRLDSV
jgi:hypothetical protein